MLQRNGGRPNGDSIRFPCLGVDSFRVAWALALALGPLVAAANAELLNGDFDSGNLSGWSTFTIFNGTIGGENFPAVVPFETRHGEISNAVCFNAGKVSSGFFGVPSGGGVKQNILAPAGKYIVTASIASDNPSREYNAEPGRFYLLIDGQNLAGFQWPQISPQTTLRRQLAIDVILATTGMHEIAFLVARDATINADTPRQYLDNVSIIAVPEPTTAALLGGIMVGAMAVRMARCWRRLN